MSRRYSPYENDLQNEVKALKEKVHANEVMLLRERLKRAEEQNQQLQMTNLLVMQDNLSRTPSQPFMHFPWGPNAPCNKEETNAFN